MSLNRAIIQGRLVADPELRTTTGGVSDANLRVAVERNFKDAEGNKESDFFNCTAWRGTADFVSKYFHKGEQILIDGKLQNSNYTDKDGNNRTATQVVVDSAFFCGGGKAAARTGGATEQPAYNVTDTPAETSFEELTEGDGDLPF